MKATKTSGTLILKKIDFSQVYRGIVRKSNERSGKVTLPYELVGQEVYIIVPKKEK